MITETTTLLQNYRELEDRLQSKESMISDLEENLQTSTAKSDNLSRQVVNLKEKLKTPWDKARRLQEEINNLEGSNTNLYSQFKTLQSENEQLRLEQYSIRSESNSLQSTVVALTTENTRLQALVDTHSSTPPSLPLEPLVESLSIDNEQLSIEKVLLLSKLTELLSDPLILRTPRIHNRMTRVASSTTIGDPLLVSSVIQDVCVNNIAPESPPAESSSHSKASSDDLRSLSDLAADNFKALMENEFSEPSEYTLHTSCPSRIASLQDRLEVSLDRKSVV